jgi:glycosyltransferase involved in cell wall biosynthesis
MDVVIVNDAANVDGGASRIAVSTAVGLREAGVNTHFFAGSGPISPELEGIRTECLGTLPYNRRPGTQGVLPGLWDREARDRFLLFIAGLDPKQTIIHFHTNRDSLSASVPHAAIDAGFAVTMTCHEYLLGCPYGSFYDQGKHVRCPERGGSLPCWLRPCNGGSYLKKLWFNTRFVRHQWAGIPGRLKHIIFVSRFSELILDRYLPRTAKRHILENPVEIPRQELSLPKDAPFLFVGHLHPGKNVVQVAAAAQAASLPVRFVGEGPDEEAIKTANPSADLTGWVDREALAKYYGNAQALVFTPIWPGTFGLVVYEAAARGVPSIVASDCAPAEWVRQHQAGIVINRSENSLQEAMHELTDPNRRNELGANAYKAFWAEDRSLTAYITKLRAIYEEMLA